MNTPSGSVKVHWNAWCRLKMVPRPIPKRHHWLVLAAAAAARCGHPLTKRTLRIQSNLQFSQLLRFRELVTLTLAIGQNITITMHGSRNCPWHRNICVYRRCDWTLTSSLKLCDCYRQSKSEVGSFSSKFNVAFTLTDGQVVSSKKGFTFAFAIA